MNRITALCSLLVALGLLVATSKTSFAQEGSIAGALVDAENGEPLIGAHVIIEGTTIGSTTDLDGNYRVTGIAPGRYDLRFSYIGYQSRIVKDIDVAADDMVVVDIALSPEAVGLDEVVVEARALANTEAALLRNRQKASAVSDAISAEAMSRSGSGNVADAMMSMTGASVVGGKYVYIRGLGDRYSNTTLNGTLLPSADPDRKAFQLDLIPSHLLDHIVTLKTFTPDKPGSFSGGLVDVGTKSFPDAFTLRLSLSTTYDSEASLSPSFLAIPESPISWRGVSNGAFDLPDLLADPSIPIPKEQDARDFRNGKSDASRSAAADSLHRMSRAFGSPLTPDRITAPLNRSYSGSIGGQIALFGEPLGYTGSMTYNRSYSSYDNAVFGRWDLIGATFADAEVLTPEVYYGDSRAVRSILGADALEEGNYINAQGTEETNWGASGTLSYRLHRNHIVESTLLRTQSGTAQARLLAGFRDQTRNSTFVTRSLHYTERALRSVQLRGEHAFSQFSVKWKGSLSETKQDEPDLRYFSSIVNVRPSSDGRLDTLYYLPGANEAPPTRFYRKLEEGSRSFALDLELPFRQGQGRGSRVAIGGAIDNAERTFRQRRFQYQDGGAGNFQDLKGDASAYFAAAGIADTVQVDGGLYYRFGPYITETSPARSNYDAESSILAGYAMGDVSLTHSLRVIGGVRLESTRYQTESLDAILPDSIRLGILDDLDVLPSLNVVYGIGDAMNLRGAITRTLARPTFREMAPYQSFDFVGGYIFEGNPRVERTFITNVDVRWEWFRRPGEIVAVSAFYKYMDEPIERVIRAQGEGKFTTVRNVPSARVYGLELEVRTHLGDFLHLPVLRDFQAGGNLSFVESVVDIPEEEYRLILASHAGAPSKRPLEGQSPFLLNLDLTYDNPSSGTAASLYFNVFGRRLLAVTRGAAPDVSEMPRADLDFTASHPLVRGFRLKAAATNLLGSGIRQVQHFKGADYTYFSHDRARTFTLGVTYEMN